MRYISLEYVWICMGISNIVYLFFFPKCENKEDTEASGLNGFFVCFFFFKVDKSGATIYNEGSQCFPFKTQFLNCLQLLPNVFGLTFFFFSSTLPG